MPNVLCVHPSLPARTVKDVVASSPEETAAYFKTELAKYTKVAQAANIRTD